MPTAFGETPRVKSPRAGSLRWEFTYTEAEIDAIPSDPEIPEYMKRDPELKEDFRAFSRLVKQTQRIRPLENWEREGLVERSRPEASGDHLPCRQHRLTARAEQRNRAVKRRPDDEFVKALQLESLGVDYVERVTEKGVRKISLDMKVMIAEDGRLEVEEMRCDLDHLEEALRRGRSFKDEMGQEAREPHWEEPDRVERFSNYTVSFFATADTKGMAAVALKLEQRDKVQGPRKRRFEVFFAASADLKVVGVGREAEVERGISRKWYAVVTPIELIAPGRCQGPSGGVLPGQRRGRNQGPRFVEP